MLCCTFYYNDIIIYNLLLPSLGSLRTARLVHSAVLKHLQYITALENQEKKSIVDVLEVLAKCKLLPEIWAFPTISVAIVA